MIFFLENHCGLIRAFPKSETARDFLKIKADIYKKPRKCFNLILCKEMFDYLRIVEKFAGEKIVFLGDVSYEKTSSRSTKLRPNMVEYLNRYGYSVD